MLVDSHCHLDRLDLKPYNGSLDEAIKASKNRGVQRLLCVSIDLDNANNVLDIASRYQHIFASVGVHPLEIDPHLTREKLSQLAQKEKVVAIGETGLDYFKGDKEKNIQKDSFIKHIEVSKQENLPLIVHTRKAKEDTLSLIDQYANKETSGVLHCFTEDWDMAKKAIDMNFYISISGIVTFKKANELQDVVRKLPLDKLLLETDSPYLAPVPYRGKSNEPKYVLEVAKYVALLKNVSLEIILENTTKNFFNLFSKAY